MGFADEHGQVIKPSLQGGIVATYYAGSLLGAFLAGQFSDKLDICVFFICLGHLIASRIFTHRQM
jgi:MFS family permease